MLGYIQGQAGDGNKGKWDVTTAPGGGGNWGGSCLAVPKQSKHPKEAAELVRVPDQPGGPGRGVQGGRQPAVLAGGAARTRRCSRSTNPYFNNAPVGQIFGAGAKQLQPVYLGPKNQVVRDAVENALLAVRAGQLKPRGRLGQGGQGRPAGREVS